METLLETGRPRSLDGRIAEIGGRVLDGGSITFEELVLLFERTDCDPFELFPFADRLRRRAFGNRAHLCSIVNAKSGHCPENCGFCTQSAFHPTTAINRYPMISTEAIVEAARKAHGQKATALGIVTAVRGYRHTDPDFQKVLAGVRAIRADGKVEAHGSLGILGREEFRLLKEAGLTEINHNLETGRSYFPKVCDTHTYEERVETIRHAKEFGIRVCSGGILGMGEEPVHRAELAWALKELEVEEVPLNFMVSIEGTRFAGAGIPPPSPLDLLKAVALFRLTLPRANIFICAGRGRLRDLQSLVFIAGASGIMVGDFLTTKNRSVADDLKMLEDLGFEV